MYTPTEQELKELGFKKTTFPPGCYYVFSDEHSDIWYDSRANTFDISDIELYPTSRKDIETLIRLLTPPQEDK